MNLSQNPIFKDRRDAGRLLAHRLKYYTQKTNCWILALPRGGVPVAHEISNVLEIPYDIFLARKLGIPGNEELAMGALAEGGFSILDDHRIALAGVDEEQIQKIIARERAEMNRRMAIYRGARKPPEIKDKTIVLVDDGIATGLTMKAVIKALKNQEPSKIIVAAPVASPQAIKEIKGEVDQIICLSIPQEFTGVGQSYRQFNQLTDEEVIAYLRF